MVQPGPRRKGRRRVGRVAALLAVSAIVSLPISFVAAMLLTPALWRLEPVFGLELAGHSGPSDWIIETIFGLFTVALFAILLYLTRGAPNAQPGGLSVNEEREPTWAGPWDCGVVDRHSSSRARNAPPE